MIIIVCVYVLNFTIQNLPADDDNIAEDPGISPDMNLTGTDDEELDHDLWGSPSPPLVSEEEEEELNPSTLLGMLLTC